MWRAFGATHSIFYGIVITPEINDFRCCEKKVCVKNGDFRKFSKICYLFKYVEWKEDKISIRMVYSIGIGKYSHVSIIRTLWFPRKIPDYRIFRIIEFIKMLQYFFNKIQETSYIKFAP